MSIISTFSGNSLKITDFEQAKRIAERILERQDTMHSTTQTAVNSLSALKGIIKCDGISETLGSLSTAIRINSANVNVLLGNIAAFIQRQLGSYEAANEQALTGTQDALSLLDNIK